MVLQDDEDLLRILGTLGFDYQVLPEFECVFNNSISNFKMFCGTKK